MAIPAITPAEIRTWAGLPAEVPETLLTEHIGVAARDLSRRTGQQEPTAGQEDDWAEALTVRAIASAFPWLNTFALSGSAKVGRLEGSVEYRFLTPDEVKARVDELMDQFDELVARLAPASRDDDDTAAVSTGGITLIAI